LKVIRRRIGHEERAYEDLLKFNLFGGKYRRKQLVEEVKKAIKEFEG
jgi:hypothetical protein